MKTKEESARDYCNIPQDLFIDDEERYYRDFQKYDGFKSGVEFAESWISVEDELPDQIAHREKQSNGNILIFYENYIVKGYYKNKARSHDVLMGVWMPCSVCWYFNVILPQNSIAFVVTHWRPINRK